jgi:hypothetical protein
MRSFKKLSLIFVIVIFCLMSCKKDTAAVDMQYGYFGLIPGRYVDYQVTEIDHDENLVIKHDTSYYQLRTLIGDTIIDNEGRVARRFIRFKRKSSTDSWTETDIWTAIIVDRRAELVEENQRRIKLIFQPALAKTWNPNAFNNDEELEAKFISVHGSMKVGPFEFDSTLVVDQENFFSMIDYRRKSEVYAKNVGMISKYYKALKISNFDTVKVKYGKELFYKLINFGIQ